MVNQFFNYIRVSAPRQMPGRAAPASRLRLFLMLALTCKHYPLQALSWSNGEILIPLVFPGRAC
jgi:hypothetical protein